MIEQALTKAFSDNFVAYYRAHTAHANITGRNFVSDHKLLGDIYEHLQEQIDTLGEFLRTIKVKMPETLAEVINNSSIEDEEPVDYLSNTYYVLEELLDTFIILQQVADEDYKYKHIGNYAQDQVTVLSKFCWMLRATIEE